jgi:hypothetical protein
LKKSEFFNTAKQSLLALTPARASINKMVHRTGRWDSQTSPATLTGDGGDVLAL